jgi:phosphotriesterase-related protein
LQRLSDAAGIRFVTNTGQYKPPFLPEATYGATPEELAELWIGEFENGIEGTSVRPGFVKTAVAPEPLEKVHRTVIAAAALTSKQTGLPIATHTGVADRAQEILDILESYGVDSTRWIFVHAQNEDSQEKLMEIANRGAWIELDGLNEQSAEKHLRSLMNLLDAGHHRILLSHDSGWYRVGEPDGGAINGYAYLFDHFIPLMRSNGIEDSTIHSICAVNPGQAFSIRED